MNALNNLSHDLNIITRENSQVTLNSETPAAPKGAANVNWQVDEFGNISAFVGSGPSFPSGFNQVSAFGDSLTAGNEDGTGITYPNQLQPIINLLVNNLGIGGQTSSQIAVRMNGYYGKTEQTFSSSFTIPTYGTVAVTFQSGFEPVNNQNGTYPSGVPIQFSAAGVSYSGRVTTSDNVNYTFTPNPYPSSAAVIPSGTSWSTQVGDTLNGISIIWAGRNNTGNQSQVLADIAAMVSSAQSSGTDYRVLTIPNAAYEVKGTSAYNSVLSINDSIVSTYGDKAIDIRALLVESYDAGNQADVIDHTNDVPPYSLRAQDVSGTVTGMSSTTTMSFTTSAPLGSGNVMSIGSELIEITGGTSGAYTGTRGYAGTVPAVYADGTAFTAVDPLHLGQNGSSPSNPNATNGYVLVAQKIALSLGNNTPFITAASLNSALKSVTSISLTAQEGPTSPLLEITGTPYAGNNYNSQPLLYFNEASSEPPNGYEAWNQQGTFLGINSAANSAADYIRCIKNGELFQGFRVTSEGTVQTNRVEVVSGDGGAYGAISPGNNGGSVLIEAQYNNNLTVPLLIINNGVQNSTGDICQFQFGGSTKTTIDYTGSVHTPSAIITGPTPSVGANQIGIGNTTSSTATAGSSALPASPAGFLELNIGGTVYKVPYYPS